MKARIGSSFLSLNVLLRSPLLVWPRSSKQHWCNQQTVSMTNKTHRLLTAFLALAAWPALAADKPDLEKLDLAKLPPPASATGISFAKDIQPMLQASCARCHGAERPKANLRLDSLEAVLKGGEDGKVIIPGDSKKSWLVIAAARIDDQTAMPPKRRPGGPGGPGRGPGGPGGPGGPPPGGAGGPGGPGGPPPGGPGGRGGFGPPPTPLTTEQVSLLRAWVDQGAK
jgi:Planctomycete cytochrome C